MKIFAAVLVQLEPSPSKRLIGEYDLSQFGYFQRSSIQEFMGFFAKTVAERTPAGQRQSIEEQGYVFHVHVRRQDLAAVVICDAEYPRRTAFVLLNQIQDDFLKSFPVSTSWSPQMTFPALKEMLTKFQDPAQADNLTRVQKELDETKIIMHKTIESVLKRGEQLDDLVAKSDELNTASKAFYKTAKSTNSCCKLM